jgi:alpha-beta hydrolase superfamily lysophospholipase
VGTKVLHAVGAARPELVVPRTVSGVYSDSLHRDRRGEWAFDRAWKPATSFPVRTGWLRAVRTGHAAVHRGIEVGAPALVLASDASAAVREWDDLAMRTDIVIDVEQVERWAPRLGSRVTYRRLDGAMHDVYLSARPVRERAYDVTLRWLEGVVPR